MLVSWRTYAARTGVLEHRFPFVCPHCRLEVDALVQSVGSSTSIALDGGMGASVSAQTGAAQIAYWNARRALEEAACPQCGDVSPEARRADDALRRKLEWKTRFPARIAIATAIAIALLVAYPAVHDLRHSSTLLVASMALVLTIFGGLYALLVWPPRRPSPVTASVYYWRSGLDRLAGWTPAPASPLSALPPPSSHAHWVGLGGGALAAAVCAVAFCLWIFTFKDVYVDGAGTVRLDGIPAAEWEITESRFDDGTMRHLFVRKGEPHRIDVVADDGTIHGPFDLPAKDAYGWIVAPKANTNDVCFVETLTVYGGTVGPGANLLANPTGVIALPRDYDDVFEASPKMQKVKSGQVVERWSLRSVSCKAFLGDSEPAHP